MKTLNVITISLALALSGCGDDDDNHQHADTGHQHADGGVNVNEEACEHLKKGPFVDVTAGKDLKSAVAIKADHKAYRVTLPTGAAGYASFAASAKVELTIFASAAVPVALQDDQGKAVTFESTATSVTECTEVKGKFVADLTGAGAYYLKLGPSAASSKVTLVLEAGSH